MTLSIDVQFKYFFATIVAGIGIGVFFDVYRIIRGFNYKKGILSSISDLLFWILMSLFTFIFLLNTNNLNVRYYTFIGLVFGFIIYMCAVSRYVIALLRWVVYLFIKIIRIIFFILFYPIRLLIIGIRFSIYNIILLFRRKT